MKARGAFFQGNVLEQAQQLGVVVRVGGIRGRAVRAPVQRGKTRRMHAGRAVQCIHFQTGIVGKNEIGSGIWRLGAGELALQPLCKFNGLFCCVAGERVGVFDNFRRAGKIVEREKLKPVAEDGADFAHLVGVARGDEQRNHVRTITGGKPVWQPQTLQFICALKKSWFARKRRLLSKISTAVP